jgi:ketosteroid isomerase-like protein
VSAAANVELVRSWIDAYNARDVDAFVAQCDPAVEFHSLFAAVGGGLYREHDGVRKWYRDLEDTWGDEVSIEPEVLFDLGEQVLVFAVLHGRGRQSGVDVAMPYAVVSRWRDGLVVYYKTFLDRDEALRELGVTEDELEPIAP